MLPCKIVVKEREGKKKIIYNSDNLVVFLFFIISLFFHSLVFLFSSLDLAKDVTVTNVTVTVTHIHVT